MLGFGLMKNITIILIVLTVSNCYQVLLEKYLPELITQAFSASPHREDFLYKPDDFLNITDSTLNSILFMAQRGVKLEMTVKNETESTLPITIDTKGLSQLIPELSSLGDNLPMQLRVYETFGVHPVPTVTTHFDGTSIQFQLGLDMSVLDETNKNDEAQKKNGEYKLLLTTKLSGHIQLQINADNELLSIYIPDFTIDNIEILQDGLGGVQVERFTDNLNMMIGVALQQVKPQLQNIDILAKINERTKLNYTDIDVFYNKGYVLITLK